MTSSSNFDDLPNELYYLIFEYLNPIDILYSFSNQNARLNRLITNYLKHSFFHVDLKHLNREVFEYYLETNILFEDIQSLSLTGEQFQLLSNKMNEDKIRCLELNLNRNLLISTPQWKYFQNLEKLKISSFSIVWNRCSTTFWKLQHVEINLKSNSNLIELIYLLPIVEKLHVFMDSDVSKYC